MRSKAAAVQEAKAQKAAADKAAQASATLEALATEVAHWNLATVQIATEALKMSLCQLKQCSSSSGACFCLAPLSPSTKLSIFAFLSFSLCACLYTYVLSLPGPRGSAKSRRSCCQRRSESTCRGWSLCAVHQTTQGLHFILASFS